MIFMYFILIGGMLILFIYMTSVASNKKFMFSNMLMNLTYLWIMSITMMMLVDSFLYANTLNNLETFINNKFLLFNFTINKYYNYPNYFIFYMSIIYLLITLIAVVKNFNINSGPLRPKN